MAKDVPTITGAELTNIEITDNTETGISFLAEESTKDS
jgi:hypothetical protein